MIARHDCPSELRQQRVDEAYEREQALLERRHWPTPALPTPTEPEPLCEACASPAGLVDYDAGGTVLDAYTGEMVPNVTLTFCAVCRPEDRERDLRERGLT